MTCVLFVDDHPIVLQGCRTALSDLGVDEIIEADSIVAGYRAFLRHDPKVSVLDLTFRGDDLAGLTLISRITQTKPDARILVFSMHNNPVIVSKAIENGALGYVLKDMSSIEFTRAYRKVEAGEPYLSHSLALQVAMLQAKRNSTATSALTGREIEILALLGRGNSYDKIAAKLGISYKTVTNICSHMRAKLNLSSLAALIRFAIENDPSRPAERLDLATSD